MNTTYEWLYAKVDAMLEEVNKAKKVELERLAGELQLTPGGRIDLFNTMTELRARWGTEVSALGLQIGIRLTASAIRN